MANTVVLGDLEKYKGDTTLKFDGIDDVANFPQIEFTDSDMGSIELQCVYITTSVDNYPIGKVSDFGNWIGYLTNGNIAVRFSDGTYFTSPSGVVSDGYYSIKLTFNSGVGEFFIDGVSVGTQSTVGKTLLLSVLGEGRRIKYAGDVCRVVINKNGSVYADYINSSNFGDTTLVDNSGNGNDGTIVGAQWWKKEVDQNFATSQLYKDTLVSPLTEDQYVIYTDATPYYGSDDPFWNPYNQDATYSFSVVQQSLGARAGAYHYSFSYEY